MNAGIDLQGSFIESLKDFGIPTSRVCAALVRRGSKWETIRPDQPVIKCIPNISYSYRLYVSGPILHLGFT